MLVRNLVRIMRTMRLPHMPQRPHWQSQILIVKNYPAMETYYLLASKQLFILDCLSRRLIVLFELILRRCS